VHRGGGLDRRAFLIGIIWSAAGSWGRQFLSLIILVVSARLLSPAEFGLISIPAIFLMVKEASLDWALNETLVRTPDLTDRQLNSAFWFSVLIGAVLAMVILVCGGWIAAATGTSAFASINASLLLCYPLTGATAVLEAKLRRDLGFRVLAIRPAIALLTAGAVSIAMILAGFGVWALVAQIVVEKAVGSLLLLRVSSWRPNLTFSRSHITGLMPDFLSIAGAQLLSHGARNIDRIVIGIFFSPAVLGAYVLAGRIVETATSLLLQGVNRVTYVLFSKLQGETGQLQVALRTVSETTAIIAIPAFVGLSLLAPDVVPLLFGQQWEAAGILLQILILAGIPQVIAGYTDSIARATGNANLFLSNMAVTATITATALGLTLALQAGPATIAAVPLVRETAGLIGGLLIVHFVVKIPVAQLLRSILPVLCSVAIMLGVVQTAQPTIEDNFRQPTVLVICIFLGVATYASSILLTARASISRIWAFVRELR
jgi:O-antigen/teichoic acid export membrane protein